MEVFKKRLDSSLLALCNESCNVQGVRLDDLLGPFQLYGSMPAKEQETLNLLLLSSSRFLQLRYEMPRQGFSDIHIISFIAGSSSWWTNLENIEDGYF